MVKIGYLHNRKQEPTKLNPIKPGPPAPSPKPATTLIDIGVNTADSEVVVRTNLDFELLASVSSTINHWGRSKVIDHQHEPKAEGNAQLLFDARCMCPKALGRVVDCIWSFRKRTPALPTNFTGTCHIKFEPEDGIMELVQLNQAMVCFNLSDGLFVPQTALDRRLTWTIKDAIRTKTLTKEEVMVLWEHARDEQENKYLKIALHGMVDILDDLKADTPKGTAKPTISSIVAHLSLVPELIGKMRDIRDKKAARLRASARDAFRH
jgi:hypothetical protein